MKAEEGEGDDLSAESSLKRHVGAKTSERLGLTVLVGRSRGVPAELRRKSLFPEEVPQLRHIARAPSQLPTP